MEEITYEGYGPHGVAILVDVLTDTKNRSLSNLRQAFIQSLSSGISPAAFGHERVPDLDFFFGWAAAILESPF